MTLAGLDELEAEQRSVQDVVRAIGADDWLSPTPAWGWDVRDTIAHLADTDEVAADTMTGGPGSLSARGELAASTEDVTYRGVLRGRCIDGSAVLAWWEAAAARERDLFTKLDPDTRVPWGLGMKPRSFVSARLMETWAHGLDVYAALGAEPVDTDRLAHVAWLATKALPYAFSVVGRPQPPEPVRVELTLPSGAPWTDGPEGAENLIRGSAGQYCRVFVQRLPMSKATDIEVRGEAAGAAIEVARAFL
ncbi:MAG: maleylpyruvate isomerase family mycothiol-dependent enzyme [Actinomycetota bacterium]|nr:maleylpyruvate isomerase family mycothiol-dependent enzyme [Actinomycetota bacterium]